MTLSKAISLACLVVGVFLGSLAWLFYSTGECGIAALLAFGCGFNIANAISNALPDRKVKP